MTANDHAALRTAHAEGEHIDHHPGCPTCAWFSLPTTRAGIAERMAVVRALHEQDLVWGPDIETAHQIEDKIARGTLAMIAAGSEPDPWGLAREVARSSARRE